MKTNIFLISVAFCLLSLNGYSQTIKDKINKQAEDPATKENAAKADVYVQKNIIYDTATINKKEAVVLKQQPHKVLIHKKRKKKIKIKHS